MNAFDGREKDFEARFKHDQELQFKVKARRNRPLGLWAAERIGLSGAASRGLVPRGRRRHAGCGHGARCRQGPRRSHCEGPGPATAAQGQFELDHLAEHAKQQIMQE